MPCAFLPRARMPPQRSRARDAARARRAVVASMDPMQRAARHAMRMAGTTALQDLLAEVAGRRRSAHDTAARIRDLARARRTAVLAARVMGGARTTHVSRVTLLLAVETAPRRARVRAAAAAAAANSGPMVLSGYVRGKGYSFPRHPPINGLCNSRLCRPRLRPLR